MEIFNLIPTIYQKLTLFVLIFSRISVLFATMLMFRRDLVSPKVTLSLSLILSVYVLLYFQNEKINYDVFSIQMLVEVLLQMFVGFIAGLILNIVFEVFSAFGQVLSTQIGLSLASLIDPKLGNITNLTHFYAYSVLLIFLFLNGHLFMMKTIVESFVTLPINYMFSPSKIIMDVLGYSSVIFTGSIMLSITIVIVIMLANFALAVMSKFAPQFNLFSIGVNMSLIVGLIYIYITFDLFLLKGTSVLEAGMAFLKQALTQLR
jgi:flagellar biosynthetic protein FliR